MLKEQAMNLEAVKKDETITEINLRSLVAMDMEPMHFLQAFQGSIIVTTNDYMTRDPQTFEGNTHLDDQQVMMFQILGIPGLNQRAREVAPFKSSLTSTGLFMLLSRSRIFFWAG